MTFLLRDSRPVMVEPEGGVIGCYDGARSVVLSGNIGTEGLAAGRETVWTASFDKASGALTSYTLGRKEMLSAPVKPCFNRAPTENDLGATLPSRYALWRNPEFKVKDFNLSKAGSSCLVEVTFEPLGGIVPLSLFYEVRPDGSISIVERMAAAPQAPDMFRFGLEFAMPGTFSELDFFGLGPWENYIDRSSAAVLGRFRQSVSEQYHMGYVRTQESGTHTGLRFFRVLDAMGNGIELASAEDFSASALPYSVDDLDVSKPEGDSPELNANGQRGVPRHSLELKPSGSTWVHADLVQMGVGGVDSWGRKPLEQYLLHPVEREFRLVLSPILNM